MTKVAGPSGQMVWIRGGPHSLDRRNVLEAVEGSLRRLGTDYIDLYQTHWPDRNVPMFGDVDYDPAASYSASCPRHSGASAKPLFPPGQAHRTRLCRLGPDRGDPCSPGHCGEAGQGPLHRPKQRDALWAHAA